ncbi:hypothetical protein AAFP35_21615 [Gordonia sp. CPCC 206044]|uniref:hypothetical protein n=1 Tax=Gordonia sp. CPCC 206044 TaxID=3140793 RepID=UPI003AF38FD3
MYRSRACLAVLAAVALGLTGCASDDETTDKAATSSASAGCTDDSTAGRDDVRLLPIPPAKVSLLDAGTGPRRVASGAPNRTSPQALTLVTTSSVKSSGDTDAQTVEMPLQARFHCTDNTDLELTLGTVTSPDAELGGQLGPVAGSHAGIALGPGSTPISLRLAPADDAGPQARLAVEQSLLQALQLSVPLPTEPIGTGARWQVERTINSAVTVTQHIDATVRSWHDDVLTLDVTVEETPVNSVFVIPGSDQTLSISRFSSGGSGQLTVDLSRGLPVGGRIELSGARELVGADPGRPLLQQTGLSVGWR